MTQTTRGNPSVSAVAHGSVPNISVLRGRHRHATSFSQSGPSRTMVDLMGTQNSKRFSKEQKRGRSRLQEPKSREETPKKGSDGGGATQIRNMNALQKCKERPRSMPARRIREPEKRGRCLVILNEASAHLVGDLDSRVTGPALGSVEGDDAHRVFVLPFE